MRTKAHRMLAALTILASALVPAVSPAEELHYSMTCRENPPGHAARFTCKRHYALVVTKAFREFKAATRHASEVQQVLEAAGLLPLSGHRDFGAWKLDEEGRLVDAAGQRQEARSAEENGWFVSLERSDDYPELAPGFFVVAVASDGRKQAWAASKRVKAASVDNYVRYVSDETWMCGS